MKKLTFALFSILQVLPLSAQSTYGWHDLGATTKFHQTTVCPAARGTGMGQDWANYDFYSNCPGVFDDWGGGVWDTKRNRLIVWGGGHAGYNGNEVYALYPFAGQTLPPTSPPTSSCSSTTSPAWCRLNYPSQYAYSVAPSCAVNASDNTPTARHTYVLLTYDTVNDAMVSFGGGVNSTCPGSDIDQSVWALYFASNGLPDTTKGTFNTGWVYENSVGASPVGDVGYAAWDPNTQTSFLIEQGGDEYQYTLASNTLSHISTTAPNSACTACSAVVDPDRKYLFLVGTSYGTGLPVFRFHYSGIAPTDSVGGWAEITSNTTGCSGLTNNATGGSQVVFDPDDHKIRFWYGTSGGSNQTMTTFDPATFQCTTETPPGFTLPVPTFGGTNGIFGRFQFSAQNHTFIACTDTESDCASLVLHPNGSDGLGNSRSCCVDIDGDNYGWGPLIVGPYTDGVASTIVSPSTTYPITYVSGMTCPAFTNITVTFTNGGGSGLTGTTRTDSGGNPQGIVLTTYPTNYTSAPTTATSTSCTGTGTFAGATLVTMLSSASHNFNNPDEISRILIVTGGTGFTTGSYNVDAVVTNNAILPNLIATAGSTGGHWYLDGVLGADVDDNDASIHDLPGAISLYGSLQAYMRHIGYDNNGGRVFIIDPANGNDTSCAGHYGTLAGGISSITPCQTWYPGIYTQGITSDDIIMVRGYYPGIPGGLPTQTISGVQMGFGSSGASGHPIHLIAYPGEYALVDNSTTTEQSGVSLDFQNWIVVDGVNSSGGFGGSSGCWSGGGPQNNIVMRHGYLTKCADGGVQANDGIVDFTVEYTVGALMNNAACGNGCQHVIYVGARDNPDSRFFVRDNIFHDANDYPAVQWNGRGTTVSIDHNWIYGNPGNQMGIALYMGLSYSKVTDNLIVNTGGGIHFSNYDGNCYDIGTTNLVCPWNQVYNLIAHNTIVIGLNPDGSYAGNPALQVENSSTGCPPVYGTVSLSAGQKVLYPGTLTGGVIYTSIAGVNSTPPSSDWTTGSVCNMTKQGDLGHNVFAENIIETNSVTVPALFPVQALGSSCVLDSSDDSLSSSSFINNIFWQGGGFTNSSVITTCSTGGGAAVGRSFSWLNNPSNGAASWASTSAGNINADPTFVAYSTSNFANISAINLNLSSGSPGAAAGINSIPTSLSTNVANGAFPHIDLFGKLAPSTLPNVGTLEGVSGCNITPSSLGPWTVTQSPGSTLMESGCNTSTFSLSGSWPSGVSGCSSGSGPSCTLSGTATTAGTYTPSVSFDTATNPYSIVVNAAPVITSPTTTLPSGTQGSLYNGTGSLPITVSPTGTTPTICTLSSGTLPSGMTVSSACGTGLNGTPTASGTFTNIKFTATDANGITSTVPASGTFTLVINPSGTQPLNIGISGPGVFGVGVKHIPQFNFDLRYFNPFRLFPRY